MQHRRAVIAVAASIVVGLAGRTAAGAEGFAIGAEGGYYDMTNARNSAKAVFGDTAGGASFGLFARVGLGRSFFVGAGARYFQRSGERAFVADKSSEPFRLGHPLEVRILPVHGLVGYRFSPDAKLSPYVSLGLGMTSYREESEVAGEVFKESRSKPSGLVALGAEYGRGSVRAGLEVTYTLAPKTIGEGGVSKVYGEDDVGGLGAMARLVFVP